MPNKNVEFGKRLAKLRSSLDINTEAKAYVWIQSKSTMEGVPDTVFQRIKAKAAAQFPGKYSTQKYVINTEAKAYIDLNR